MLSSIPNEIFIHHIFAHLDLKGIIASISVSSIIKSRLDTYHNWSDILKIKHDILFNAIKKYEMFTPTITIIKQMIYISQIHDINYYKFTYYSCVFNLYDLNLFMTKINNECNDYEFMEACKCSDDRILENMLSCKTKINYNDIDYAVSYGKHKILKRLISKYYFNKDQNQINIDMAKLLPVAAKSGSLETVEILTNDSKLEYTSNMIKTCIINSVKCDDVSMLIYLLRIYKISKGNIMNDIYDTAKNNYSYKVAKYILDNKLLSKKNKYITGWFNISHLSLIQSILSNRNLGIRETIGILYHISTNLCYNAMIIFLTFLVIAIFFILIYPCMKANEYYDKYK
jgi:hypothetical protein